jgi:hypothetical protein
MLWSHIVELMHANPPWPNKRKYKENDIINLLLLNQYPMVNHGNWSSQFPRWPFCKPNLHKPCLTIWTTFFTNWFASRSSWEVFHWSIKACSHRELGTLPTIFFYNSSRLLRELQIHLICNPKMHMQLFHYICLRMQQFQSILEMFHYHHHILILMNGER